jgi:hypothetical protein
MEDIRLLKDTQPEDGASTQQKVEESTQLVPIENSFEDENIRNLFGQWE